MVQQGSEVHAQTALVVPTHNKPNLAIQGTCVKRELPNACDTLVSPAPNQLDGEPCGGGPQRVIHSSLERNAADHQYGDKANREKEGRLWEASDG